MEIRKTLHHVIQANRYWIALIFGGPFQFEQESQIPESFELIVQQFKETHEQESNWIAGIQGNELEESLETPFIPGARFTVEEALVQVCLHSLGHRAQCLSRLRMLGATPPGIDFITWLVKKPEPDWPT